MGTPLAEGLRFFRDGTLRVGTLHEFRDQERHGPHVGDADEGVRKTVLSHPGEVVINTAEKSPAAAYLREHLLSDEQRRRNVAVDIRFAAGASIVSHQSSENLLLYCFARLTRAQTVVGLGDAGMVIVDPASFFAAISRVLGPRATFLGTFEVLYADRLTHFTLPHTVHRALMKAREYAEQFEWRALWKPQETDARPLIIRVPDARPFCRSLTS